jgi:hypothetical protein
VTVASVASPLFSSAVMSAASTAALAQVCHSDTCVEHTLSPSTLLPDHISLIPTLQSSKQFQDAVIKGDLSLADNLLQKLKGNLLELDSLPPLSLPSTTAQEEISFARNIYEHAVILSIRNEDKFSFQSYLSILKPYRFGLRFDLLTVCLSLMVTSSPSLPESPLADIITGLNLLYLLVENQLSDFHSEVSHSTISLHSHSLSSSLNC